LRIGADYTSEDARVEAVFADDAQRARAVLATAPDE
jgi:hypothetical protein